MSQRTCGSTVTEFKDCRRDDRIASRHIGRLATPFWQIECVIMDLSMSGAKLLSQQLPGKGDEIAVQVPRAGCARAKVKWLKGNIAGIEFDREPGSFNQISERINRLSVRTFLEQNSFW